MKLLRRVLGVLTLAGAVAGALRVRGSGGTPPQHGGWRELDLDEPLDDVADDDGADVAVADPSSAR